jgi:uncharacterized protein (DUF885 family)
MEQVVEMDHRFDQLTDQFLSGYFRFNPTFATDLGFHEYDSLLNDQSAEAVQAEIKWLEDFQEQLRREIDPTALSVERQIDYDVLRSAIDASRLELKEIRTWQRNPGYYNWLASGSIYSLLIREYAPLDDRLHAAIERERAIPAFLEQGRNNLWAAVNSLEGVPRIWVEIALEEFGGAKDFFQTVVPGVAGQCNNNSIRETLLKENTRVLAALEEMTKSLREAVLEKARGDFALGADWFRQKLLAEEAIDTPIDQIIERGEVELRQTQAQMRAVSRQIDPDLPLEELIKKLSNDHPAPEDLVPSYQRRVDEAQRFVRERDLVTIPEGELRIVETPAFLRSLLFAALDPPGPFERSGLPTYFYVTPVESHWSAAEQEEYLRQHNSYSQIVTIFHEAFPGHYVQCAHCHRTPSRLRRVFRGGTFIEGWAHYTEQLMVDEGFGSDDPRIRLFQLHEALWRIGRLIVATRMHTQGLSMDEGIEYFMRECYQERANAIREVKRFTTDPLVLMYSWGKWQIQDLRREYAEIYGQNFSLREFHDRLLGEGESPVGVLKRILLTIQPPKHEGTKEEEGLEIRNSKSEIRNKFQ